MDRFAILASLEGWLHPSPSPFEARKKERAPQGDGSPENPIENEIGSAYTVLE